MKNTKWMAAVLGLAGLVAAKSPVETYGPLSISGSKMLDSTGKQVILRGMSLFWHYDKGGKEFYTPSALKWVMTDWHASVIRAPIGVEDRTLGGGGRIGGAISDPTLADKHIRIAIETAIDAGFYVVVDWHAHQEHTSEAVAWFGALAKEYGNTPNIIWEIFNEPTGGISATYAKAVISKIRQYSKNVILVGSSPWAQNPQSWGTDLNSFPNIAYTIHFYSDHTFFENVTATTAKQHAVFASEWGMSGSSGNGGYQSPSTGNIKKWLDVLEANGVSSCNWFVGNALPEGAATGSVQQTSATLRSQNGDYVGPSFTPSTANPWTDADYTEAGKAIRTWLRTMNPAWTLNDTALKVTKTLTITSDKAKDLILKKDTIEFSAGYSKSVAWTLKEVGRSSKSAKTTSKSSSSVSVAHVVGDKNVLSLTNFQPGETVDVTLEPKGMSASYTLSTISGVAKRVHQTDLRWVGSRLFLPTGLLPEGKRVHVAIRNAKGQAVFQTSAVVDGAGRIELGLRPRAEALQILDITADDAVIRSSLAPNF